MSENANLKLTKFAEQIIDSAFTVFFGEPVIRASTVREILKEYLEEEDERET